MGLDYGLGLRLTAEFKKVYRRRAGHLSNGVLRISCSAQLQVSASGDS